MSFSVEERKAEIKNFIIKPACAVDRCKFWTFIYKSLYFSLNRKSSPIQQSAEADQ